MKKIIITAISAIAVIASVIGCQIYDSQTNETLASAMKKDGQFKLQDFAADFNKACQEFKDTSSDESYNKIVDSFLGFTKYFYEGSAYPEVASILSSERNSKESKEKRGKSAAEKEEITKKYAEMYNGYMHDVDFCKQKYKDAYMTADKLYVYICDYVGSFYKEDDTYKKNLETAQKNLATAEKNLETKEKALEAAYAEFYDAAKNGEDVSSNTAVAKKVNTAKTAVTTAETNKTKAEAAVAKAEGDIANAKDKFIKNYSCEKEGAADYMNCEIQANTGNADMWSVASLWEKTYKLKWDYNSKK